MKLKLIKDIIYYEIFMGAIHSPSQSIGSCKRLSTYKKILQMFIKELKKESKKKDSIFYYDLGRRDGLAFLLAEYNNKIKLPEIAKIYSDCYGEHFSLKWHNS